MSRPRDAKPNAKTATLGSWEAATFPTWFGWGRTTAHVVNTGNTPVTVSFQAGLAPPDYVYLDVGENHRQHGFWGGFPVTITNLLQSDTRNNENPQIQVWVW